MSIPERNKFVQFQKTHYKKKQTLVSFSQRRASSSFSTLVSLLPQTPTTLASRKRLGVKGCRVSPLRLGVELVTSIVMWSNSRARTSCRLDAHMMHVYVWSWCVATCSVLPWEENSNPESRGLDPSTLCPLFGGQSALHWFIVVPTMCFF